MIIHTPVHVTFNHQRCQVTKAEFVQTRAPRIALVAEDGTPMAVATVNVVDIALAPNIAILKNYNENAGMLDAFVNAGLARWIASVPISPFVRGELIELLGPLAE